MGKLEEDDQRGEALAFANYFSLPHPAGWDCLSDNYFDIALSIKARGMKSVRYACVNGPRKEEEGTFCQ